MVLVKDLLRRARVRVCSYEDAMATGLAGPISAGTATKQPNLRTSSLYQRGGRFVRSYPWSEIPRNSLQC